MSIFAAAVYRRLSATETLSGMGGDSCAHHIMLTYEFSKSAFL